MARTPQTPEMRRIAALIAPFKTVPGALLPVLHAIQDGLGYIPPESFPLIAEELNISRAEVHGVVSFYRHFRTTPPGRHVLRICRAEACQSMKGAATEAHAKAKLGIGYHQTTADGAVTLEPVYCLGNCACAPSVMIGKTLHGRVTPERLDALLDELLDGPEEGR